MKLDKDEYIVTAWPELASGPGWANSPVWVIVSNSSGKMRQEVLQPDEFSYDMHVLFKPALAAHESFLHAVKELIANRPKYRARGKKDK